MKQALFSIVILIALSTLALAKVVTLTVNSQPLSGPIILTDTVSLGTNEVATIMSIYAPSQTSGNLSLVKGGVTNQLSGIELNGYNYNQVRPLVIAGPATFVLTAAATATCLVTLEIAPESFPPGKTVILPEGTVGVIHVESSTNLIQWQDEWVQTFANTNQNRFFRIRAERSLP